MVWWNRLPLVRLVIAKCRAHGWTRNSIFQFVWRLFSGNSNTKASQEDIFQELTNTARASRKKDIRMTKTMYVCATSKRLDNLPCLPLKLKPGDIQRLGNANVKVDEFTPRRLKTFNTDSGRSHLISSAIGQLKSGLASQTQD